MGSRKQLQSIDQNTMKQQPSTKEYKLHKTESEDVFDKLFHDTKHQIVQKQAKQKIHHQFEQKDEEMDDYAFNNQKLNSIAESEFPTSPRRKSRHSVCTSYKIIDNYHGDKSIRQLKKMYKQKM